MIAWLSETSLTSTRPQTAAASSSRPTGRSRCRIRWIRQSTVLSGRSMRRSFSNNSRAWGSSRNAPNRKSGVAMRLGYPQVRAPARAAPGGRIIGRFPSLRSPAMSRPSDPAPPKSDWAGLIPHAGAMSLLDAVVALGRDTHPRAQRFPPPRRSSAAQRRRAARRAPVRVRRAGDGRARRPRRARGRRRGQRRGTWSPCARSSWAARASTTSTARSTCTPNACSAATAAGSTRSASSIAAR